ncbi:rab-GTPase-TBC domain-containing protein [Dichotomocladium elegans]|nr:rab-GTPase-TBC domain-containing protein [Dichotomocladium elegans]
MAIQEARGRGNNRNVCGEKVIFMDLFNEPSLNPFTRSKNSAPKPSPLEAVISKTRPRMLPPKDPHEEKKHLQQHQAMMKKAKKLEAKKEREFHRRKEEKDKKMAQAVRLWEHDILKNWDIRRKDLRTRELWLQGLPPRCRKRVWILAIGNDLKLSKETFASSIKRIPHTTAPAKRHSDEGQSDNHILEHQRSSEWERDEIVEENSQEPEELYDLRRVRRTSSLNVLHEDPSEKVNYPESLYEQPHVTDSDGGEAVVVGVAAGSEDNDEKEEGRRAMEIEGANISASILDSGQHSSLDGDRDEDDDNDDVRVTDDDITSSDDDTSSDFSADMPFEESAATTYLSKAIDEDIIRTLPSLCVFQPDGPLFNSLRKVLHAYARQREDGSYSRGASFIAGMLLLNMNSQETFIALGNLIHRSSVLSALYSSNEQRVRGYFKIFNVAFAENLPKLYLHFKNLSLTPEHYLLDWFMTIFASILPLHLSTRLWDIFLLEGDIILFKAGLAVLKYLEPLLWGGSFGETVRILNRGFVGEERGEEAKAALAVSGHITESDQDNFFNEVLGRNGLQLDRFKFRELVAAHVLTR